MQPTIRYVGLNVHRNRLRRLKSKYLQEPVNAALYAAGEAVRADAQASILDGAILGPGHIPSKPGEPPNADTRNLDLSIDVELSRSRKSVQVTAKAHYAAALEFGTSRVAARPFMGPALRRNRNRAVYGAALAASGKRVRVFKGK